jgi:hypothetical protein
MLAICSDLDETPDAGVYLEIARFLNTTKQTAMGRGVGLECGNTIYFDMPPGQFSYWGTNDGGREMVRALMHSGHVDAVHSWGDLATERRHAERSLAELERHACRLAVWIDHSKAPSNFGPDIMRGTGDVPGSPAYHADLTLAYGIRYVWRGRTTGLTGQGVPVRYGSFAPIFRGRHPLASTRTALKEAIKVLLGRLGHPRWELHGANEICRPCMLRDGQRAWEFLRTNSSWAGPGASATAAGIEGVLTPRMLDRLVASQGTAILYTHLGKIRDRGRPFGPATERTFRHLASLRDEGKVLVTTTQRLLRYHTVRAGLRLESAVQGDKVVVTFTSVDDPVTGPRVPNSADLDGLTLTLPTMQPVEIHLADGTPLPRPTVQRNAGTTRVTLPWPPLRFPDLRGI